jgi:hypothetical protein
VDKLTRGIAPVPLKLTVCVLPAAPLLLSMIVKVPVRAPAAVGEKVTLIVHEPLAATVPAQLSLWPKLALMEMLAMVSIALPVLLRVTDCEALVAPVSCLLNVRLLMETCADGCACGVVTVDIPPPPQATALATARSAVISAAFAGNGR